MRFIVLSRDEAAQAKERGAPIVGISEIPGENGRDRVLVQIAGDSAPGLGDLVASAFAAVGITKERVAQVSGGPCRCSERQAAMNAAGAKWLGLPPGSTAPPEIDPPAQ
jgi:hypothetical protein